MSVSAKAQTVVIPMDEVIAKKTEIDLNQESDESFAFIEEYQISSNGTEENSSPVLNKETKPKFKPKFPFFMCSISLLQILLFYLVKHNILLTHLGYDPYRRHEAWRYFTITLVHESEKDLWYNILGQLLIGIPLEVVHHLMKTSAFYFISILGGTLLKGMVLRNQYGHGAFPGVYALFVTYIATTILNFNKIGGKVWKFLWLCPIGYISYAVYLLANELMENNVDYRNYVGHIGGAVTGLLVSILFLKNFEKASCGKYLQKLSTILLAIEFGTFICVNIGFPSVFLEPVYNFDYSQTFFDHQLKIVYDMLM